MGVPPTSGSNAWPLARTSRAISGKRAASLFTKTSVPRSKKRRAMVNTSSATVGNESAGLRGGARSGLARHQLRPVRSVLTTEDRSWRITPPLPSRSRHCRIGMPLATARTSAASRAISGGSALRHMPSGTEHY